MNPTILLPELPDTTDPKAVKEYLAAHQKILSDKQKDDFETSNSINKYFDELPVDGLEINWEKSPKYKLNLSTNTTLTFTDPTKDIHLQLIINHASASATLTFPSGRIKWGGGTAPTLTATQDKIDIVSLYYSVDDNIYYGMAGLNF